MHSWVLKWRRSIRIPYHGLRSDHTYYFYFTTNMWTICLISMSGCNQFHTLKEEWLCFVFENLKPQYAKLGTMWNHRAFNILWTPLLRTAHQPPSLPACMFVFFLSFAFFLSSYCAVSSFLLFFLIPSWTVKFLEIEILSILQSITSLFPTLHLILHTQAHWGR